MPSFSGIVLEPGVRIWAIVFDKITAKTKKILITEYTDDFEYLKSCRVSHYSMLRLIHIVSESPDSGAFRTYLNGALSTLVVKGAEQ